MLQIIQKGKFVAILLIDFTKASDLVDQNILIQKLQLSKCNQRAIHWIKSYLEECQQNVCVFSAQFDFKTLNYGVLQGSIFRPLFFIIL